MYSKESRALLEAIVESFKRSNAKWSMMTPANEDSEEGAMLAEGERRTDR